MADERTECTQHQGKAEDSAKWSRPRQILEGQAGGSSQPAPGLFAM